MGTAVVSVSGLRKAYGSIEAVRGIDFEVESGERFAILGPNGAGKTTTLEILEGFRKRDGGDVRVLGFDPHHGDRRLRSLVGVTLQRHGPEPYLKVRESLDLYRQYYPTPRTVEEVLRLVHLSDRADTYVRTLSGGQRRRLALAMALIGNPRLLFLDEPTSGLDPVARRQTWDLLREMREYGTTVVFTTHYMDEAQTLADRLIVIAEGRVIARGTPAEIGGDAGTVVRFRTTNAVALADVPFAAVRDDEFLAVATNDAEATLRAVLEWAADTQLHVVDLTVAQTNLEDAYLQLVQK